MLPSWACLTPSCRHRRAEENLLLLSHALSTARRELLGLEAAGDAAPRVDDTMLLDAVLHPHVVLQMATRLVNGIDEEGS